MTYITVLKFEEDIERAIRGNYFKIKRVGGYIIRIKPIEYLGVFEITTLKSSTDFRLQT